MTQTTLDLGARRRDNGVADALSHFAVETIRLTIRTFASKGTDFTAEDIVADLPTSTRDGLAAFPNVLGACFRASAKANEIVDTGRMTHARHVGARKRKIVIWRGR
jgi:hypothetical protein